MHQELCCSGSKVDSVQHLHNHINVIWEAKGLCVGDAAIPHMQQVLENDSESDESNIVCSKCVRGK